MSNSVKLATRAYLNMLRIQKKAEASKCHICNKQSTNINAYKHEIKFVCEEHTK